MPRPVDEFIRDIAKSSEWQLFFSTFPKCVDAKDCWNNDIGLYVVFDHIPILDGKERDITIKFHIDNLIPLPKLQKFLSEWYNPNNYMQAKVILKDINGIENDIPFTITHLTSAQGYNLSITGNFHINDS